VRGARIDDRLVPSTTNQCSSQQYAATQLVRPPPGAISWPSAAPTWRLCLETPPFLPWFFRFSLARHHFTVSFGFDDVTVSFESAFVSLLLVFFGEL